MRRQPFATFKGPVWSTNESNFYAVILELWEHFRSQECWPIQTIWGHCTRGVDRRLTHSDGDYLHSSGSDRDHTDNDSVRFPFFFFLVCYKILFGLYLWGKGSSEMQLGCVGVHLCSFWCVGPWLFHDPVVPLMIAVIVYLRWDRRKI